MNLYDFSNVSNEGLRQELVLAEQRMKKAKFIFGPNHMRVEAIRQLKKAIKKEMAAR